MPTYRLVEVAEKAAAEEAEEEANLDMQSEHSRNKDALNQIAEKIDEEKASVLREFTAASWRTFQLEYRNDKERGGLKSMAKCIAKPFQ